MAQPGALVTGSVSSRRHVLPRKRDQGAGQHLEGTLKGLPVTQGCGAQGCPDMLPCSRYSAPPAPLWHVLGTQTSQQPSRHPAQAKWGGASVFLTQVPLGSCLLRDVLVTFGVGAGPLSHLGSSLWASVYTAVKGQFGIKALHTSSPPGHSHR